MTSAKTYPTFVSHNQYGHALASAISLSQNEVTFNIDDLTEPLKSKLYGVIGWIDNDQALLSVGIRIFWSQNDGRINFGTGAGITWQSDPASEWEETQLKAKRLIAIASGAKF